MKSAIFAMLGLGLAVAAGGCDQGQKTGVTSTQAPDNTKVNERDQSPGALTPMSQGENQADLAITQQIRRGMMADDTLSMTAKNVKVITVDGVVTLRGPVKTAQESATIAGLAKQAGNVKRVDNQLEISAN